MTAITHTTGLQARMNVKEGALRIDFEEDPSFVRSEAVVIDLDHNEIGVIFESGYYAVGILPLDGRDEYSTVRSACLSGLGHRGREILIGAPVHIKQAH